METAPESGGGWIGIACLPTSESGVSDIAKWGETFAIPAFSIGSNLNDLMTLMAPLKNYFETINLTIYSKCITLCNCCSTLKLELLIHKKKWLYILYLQKHESIK